MQLIAVLIGLFIIYFIQIFLYNRFWNVNLRASAEFKEDQITEGDVVTLIEFIENRKWLPMPMITMKYTLDNCFKEINVKEKVLSDRYNRNEIFSILMFQRIKRKVNLICNRRGIYRINDLSILVGNLFLNDMYLCKLETKSKLTVYPKNVDYTKFIEVFQVIYGNIIMNNFMLEDPFVYRGVREYQIYDTMKMINWGATAKTGELKVNVLENTSQKDVIIFLNLQRDTIMLNSEVSEESIRLTKTLVQELNSQGIRSLIYTNGVDMETKEPIIIDKLKSGSSYMDIVNDALAHIEVKEGGNVHSFNDEKNFVDMYGSIIDKLAKREYLIFISNYQREDFQNMLLNIKKKNKPFSWIVPVSNINDLHINSGLKEEAKIWRMNWEGASGRN